MEPQSQSQSGRHEISRLGFLLLRHGALILALVPLIFLLVVVSRYAVAVPYLDQCGNWCRSWEKLIRVT